METLTELPQWADEQIDFDLTILAMQIEVLFPLHVHGLRHGLVAESFQGGGNGFHAFQVAEHVSADERDQGRWWPVAWAVARRAFVRPSGRAACV